MSRDKRLLRVDEDLIRKGAGKVTDEHIRRVTERADDITRKFSSGGPLGRFIGDLGLLLGLVSDYWQKKYRKVPYWVIGAIVFTLLYVLNPVDLVPDFIPVVGYLDDAAVMALCLAMIEQELHEYQQWKADESR